MLEYANIFYTLCSNIGTKDSKRHLILRYFSDLNRYIEMEMDFLDISSLRGTYRYVVKLEKTLKQRNKSEFRFANQLNISV